MKYVEHGEVGNHAAKLVVLCMNLKRRLFHDEKWINWSMHTDHDLRLVQTWLMMAVHDSSLSSFFFYPLLLAAWGVCVYILIQV